MYHKILVPIDGSTTSSSGLTEAIQLAKALGGIIRLIHIVNELVIVSSYDVGASIADVIDVLRKTGRTLLDDAATRVRSAGVEADAKYEEALGDQTGTHIVRHAETWPADLIVMGTHGRRGIRRMVLGSDAEFVVRHTPVPVLLVRNRHDLEDVKLALQQG